MALEVKTERAAPVASPSERGGTSGDARRRKRKNVPCWEFFQIGVLQVRVECLFRDVAQKAGSDRSGQGGGTGWRIGVGQCKPAGKDVEGACCAGCRWTVEPRFGW